MSITKILARKGRLDAGINYVLNGDKTEDQIFTACLNCDPGRECQQMLVSAPVIKCKKTPRKKCRLVAERREKR